MKLTEDLYRSHSRDYDGYCTHCDAITRFGETEPDAEEYPCEECGQDCVMGIDQALLYGHIEIEG